MPSVPELLSLLADQGKQYILRGSGRIHPPAGNLPVSYTHLDVYKRQTVGREIEMAYGLKGLEVTEEVLDVYKRQIRNPPDAFIPLPSRSQFCRKQKMLR